MLSLVLAILVVLDRTEMVRLAEMHPTVMRLKCYVGTSEKQLGI